MEQGDAKGLPKAPRITAETAIVDFKKMTAQDIMRRHLAISHQVWAPHVYCSFGELNNNTIAAPTHHLPALQKIRPTPVLLDPHAFPKPTTNSH